MVLPDGDVGRPSRADEKPSEICRPCGCDEGGMTAGTAPGEPGFGHGNRTESCRGESRSDGTTAHDTHPPQVGCRTHLSWVMSGRGGGVVKRKVRDAPAYFSPARECLRLATRLDGGGERLILAAIRATEHGTGASGPSAGSAYRPGRRYALSPSSMRRDAFPVCNRVCGETRPPISGASAHWLACRYPAVPARI